MHRVVLCSLRRSHQHIDQRSCVRSRTVRRVVQLHVHCVHNQSLHCHLGGSVGCLLRHHLHFVRGTVLLRRLVVVHVRLERRHQRAVQARHHRQARQLRLRRRRRLNGDRVHRVADFRVPHIRRLDRHHHGIGVQIDCRLESGSSRHSHTVSGPCDTTGGHREGVGEGDIVDGCVRERERVVESVGIEGWGQHSGVRGQRPQLRRAQRPAHGDFVALRHGLRHD